MIRRVGTPPGAVLLSKLRFEAATTWPRILGVNEIGDGKIGFYFDDADVPTQNAIDTLVGAHTTTPLPLSAEETLFANSIAQLKSTFNTTRTVAQANNSIDALTVILRRLYRELQ